MKMPSSPSLHLLLLMLWPLICLSAPEKRTNKSDKEDVSADTHRVTRGETLWGIAMKHNTSVGEIMEINHMESAEVKDGQVLKILRPKPPATPTAKKQTYTASEDETLRSIAKKHHIAESDLAQANPNVNSKSLKAGTKLIIPNLTSGTNPPASKSTVNHVVKDGETFSSIAKDYHVKTDDLLEANPAVKPERVREGLVLKVPVKNERR